jgi:hypothetical protein
MFSINRNKFKKYRETALRMTSGAKPLKGCNKQFTNQKVKGHVYGM